MYDINILGASPNTQWREAFWMSQLRQAVLPLRLIFQSYDLQEVHQHGLEDEWHELGDKWQQQQHDEWS